MFHTHAVGTGRSDWRVWVRVAVPSDDFAIKRSMSIDESKRIPRDTRPRAYAGVELLLDLMHLLREATDLDHESIVIACAVNAATMRPLLVGPNAPLDLIDVADPPDEYRGSISRAAVADMTGLPRETVRRKINQLIAAGMLVESRNGEVRPIQGLGDPRWQKVADEGFAAVQRFDRRLRSLGCKGISDDPGKG